MSVQSQTNRVAEIRSRYFHTCMNLKNRITHQMDCAIYAVTERGQFCDCGLIHDLRILDFALASVLYDKYEDDLSLHETGKKIKERTNKELKEQKKNIALLEKVFGPITTDMADIKQEYNNMKKIIETVFPDESEYPDCYKRLKKWFKKEAR
jgi:hypothetical protein